MEQSPRLSLAYLAPAQAQKHVTVNETFRRLDQLVQQTVLSRTTSAEPGSPADGDAYILPSSPTGTDWATFSEHSIAAYQDGAWIEIVPVEGWRAWVADSDEFMVFHGSAWAPLLEGFGVTKLGVNTAADTTNRLAVKSDAILFSHDDVTPGNDDCIVKVNKAAAGDTASVIFQTNASGRAEFGLTGDDDFHVKVSPDNFATVFEAFAIDKDTGDTTFTDRTIVMSGGSNNVLEIMTEGGGTPLSVTRYTDDVLPGVFTLRKARGSLASPSAIQSGDILGNFNINGYHSGGDFGSASQLRFYADENFTASARGSSIRLFTTATGGTSLTEKFRVAHDGALQMGGANTVIDPSRHHQLRAYSVAGLPSAATAGQMIFVSDETGGAVPAFSDGTNWRRVTDRAVVS